MGIQVCLLVVCCCVYVCMCVFVCVCVWGSPKRPVAETSHRRIGVAETSCRRNVRRRIVLPDNYLVAESAVAESSHRRIVIAETSVAELTSPKRPSTGWSKVQPPPLPGLKGKCSWKTEYSIFKYNLYKLFGFSALTNYPFFRDIRKSQFLPNFYPEIVPNLHETS